MKSIAILLCSAALCGAADFTTGQAARAVIGQSTFTAQEFGVSGTVLGGISGLAYANGTLIVADSNRFGASPDNNRVLLFNNIQSQLPAADAELTDTGRRCGVCVGQASVVLGQTGFDKNEKKSVAGDSLLQPTAVATDGRRLAIADTNFNRVLIWNSIPASNSTSADIVLGQESLTSFKSGVPRLYSDQRSLRGPQGVWIQNDRLYVADTQNHRVMIWREIPTQNNQPADIVLGFADFTANKEGLTPDPSPSSLLNPVSVSSDGTRLYVSDLGNNRVLIWNNVDDLSNNRPADIVLGQPDFTSSTSNNATKVCPSNGTGTDGNPTYPGRCAATLNFPRYALSDGQRLFIADGGNDRVLVYNHVPTTNAQPADAVLGQLDQGLNQISDSDRSKNSAADALRTPSSLAWDGANLYVSDSFNRRVLVYSQGERRIPNTGVRNAASINVYAVGAVNFSGTLKEAESVTVKIGEKEYKYTIVADDSFDNVVNQFVTLINAGAGDPLVIASPNLTLDQLVLSAREGGENGNNVTLTTTVDPTTAQIIATASGANLAGGQNAAKIAPYALVSLLGDGLAETTEAASLEASELPRELGGVRVYFDGIPAPLLYVSPTLINAQLPREVSDAESVSAYVRIRHADGTVTITTPVAVPVVAQNPGIFTISPGETDPRPGVVLHGSSFATGTIQIDGTAKAGDVATVKIEDRSYSYTVKDGDSLNTIRDSLIALINAGAEEKVVATAGGSFTRIRLAAKVEGPEGNGVPFSASANDGAQVVMTATNNALCCASTGGALVTEDNPAIPGETITILATGLGLVKQEDGVNAMVTGKIYEGPQNTEPNEFVSALAGAKTANVISASLKPGTFGLYEVVLELNPDLPTNPRTQLTIAQSFFVSNIITFPIFNPKPQ